MNSASKTQYNTVYNYLKQGIISGKYDANHTFIETEIADELNVSRTPVREAIKMLKSEHLLENIPRKGIHCRELTLEDIKPVYEVAEALEGIIAYNVARNSANLDLNTLEKSVLDMEDAFLSNNDQDWVDADYRFHSELKELSSNKFAIEMLDQIAFYIEIIRSRYTKSSTESKKRSTLQHREAYEAIKSGDAEYARSLVQNHWKSVRKQITKNL